MDQQSAMRMGKWLGPTALIFVRLSQCSVEQHRNVSEHKNHKGEIERSYDAILDAHLRGTLQTIDLATGRIFAASPIVEDAELVNHSDREPPEFPDRHLVRDQTIGRAVSDASTFLLPWNEEKKLYFFNDKECNMALAYTLLKANDFNGVVRQSEENIESCKSWPKLKDSSMAHAYYNAGLAYLLVNDHEKALSYLSESEKLKGGQIVTDTIAEAVKSAQLEDQMRRVDARTERFEQESMGNANQPAAVQPPPIPPPPAPAAQGSVEERLKKLDSLFRQGLLTRQEYDAKKAEIMRDL
jgi:tetratricopeptide (TPR) repeat protein